MSTLSVGAGANDKRFGWLLFVLILTFVLAPLADMTPERFETLSVLFTLILVVGAYSVSQKPRVLLGAVALAVPGIALEWISNLHPIQPLVLGNLAFLTAFVAYVAVVILSAVLSEEKVTRDTLYGGISVFLLMGIGWAFAYSLLAHAIPGSFPYGDVPLQELRPRFEFVFPELMYFSFVTLTTLGYGDITPTNAIARHLSTSQAIVGQLYVAILIARLVGLHLAHSVQNKD